MITTMFDHVNRGLGHVAQRGHTVSYPDCHVRGSLMELFSCIWLPRWLRCVSVMVVGVQVVQVGAVRVEGVRV
jgi:hypothetical protein